MWKDILYKNTFSLKQGENLIVNKNVGILANDELITKVTDANATIVDKIILVNDDDAINMSRILARKFGLGVGISSGANLIAAVLTADNNDNVVTIFPDDLKKYLSTDLNKDIDLNKKLISNQIKILSIEAI